MDNNPVTIKSTSADSFDMTQAQSRCRRLRKRILDVSQSVSALHIAPAFSCLEIVDALYHGVMVSQDDGYADTFIMSKGHGYLAQLVVLEDLGILPKRYLDQYCTRDGDLGAHPDLGIPGIAAATGSLGHGLGIGLGMALAERVAANANDSLPGNIYVVLSDGELQEGSTWESTLLASSNSVSNIVAIIDNNDFQSLGRTSETHPSFYPLATKFEAFGWDAIEVDGHDSRALVGAINSRGANVPLAVIAATTKGKGVSFMENVPMWHYRSPDTREFEIAMRELEEISE